MLYGNGSVWFRLVASELDYSQGMYAYKNGDCLELHSAALEERAPRERDKEKKIEPATHTHSKCSTYDLRVHANGIHSTKGGNQIQLKSSHFKQTIITSFFRQHCIHVDSNE